MCYAIPGKIIKISGRLATLDYFGELRQALCDFIQVRPGDYVYAQGGLVVDKVPPKEAAATLKFWRTRFFDLKKTDAKLALINLSNRAGSNLLAVLQKINLNRPLTNNDCLAVLKANKAPEIKLIGQTANHLRQKVLGNACCVHGILEFSNYCHNNCGYCGIGKNCSVKRYRLTVSEICRLAGVAVKKHGFKALVLQSGEDLWYSEAKLLQLIKHLKKLGVLIFLSLGERDKHLYQKLYRAGARAALLRFETSNEKIYSQLKPDSSLTKRLTLIKSLKNMGYLLATGFILGLPGETSQDIINNLLLTKSLGPDMYSFGPLIPAPNTLLSNNHLTDQSLAIKIIALARFIDRPAKILLTTAMETLSKNLKTEGLLSGANSLMINLTPPQLKQCYAIYPRQISNLATAQQIKKTVALLYRLGRAPLDLGY